MLFVFFSDSGYQCVRLVRRDESVLELYLGRYKFSSLFVLFKGPEYTWYIFCPFLQWKQLSCSFSYTGPFRKGIYSKRKEFVQTANVKATREL